MAYDSGTVQKIVELSRQGLSSREISNELGIRSKSTVNNILNRTHNRAEISGKTEKGQGARVLFIDIETAPCEALVFGRYNINLSNSHITKHGGQIISVCYVFNNEEDVHTLCMTPSESLARDDSRIVGALWEVFENADVAVAQNGDRFDFPAIKTRMMLAGLPPPKTIKTIDTLKIAKQLKFPANNLDTLAGYLGLGSKYKHSGIDLWKGCLEGDQESLDEMVTYNIPDTLLLRDIYNTIKMFDSRHPNLAHYYNDDEVRCPVCGSTDVEDTGHSIYTPVSEFAEVVCKGCGHRSRKRKPLNNKEKRANLLISPKSTG